MNGNYTVKYLGHSAFLVETDKYYLFFDYVGTTEEDEYSVKEESIDFEEYKDKKIIMFYSHNHFDHYNKEIHELTQKYRNSISVLGDIESSLNNTISIKPREVKIIDDITIYTASSTDLGVCYLIDVNGFVIVYGGDNADWGDGDEANKMYYEEIDYLSDLNLKTDLAFIPVCTFVGLRPKDMTKGAIYSIIKLDPKVVFPMHASGREYLYKEFKEDALKNNCSSEIVCMEELGQIYKIKGS